MLGWSSLQPNILDLDEDCRRVSNDNLAKKRGGDMKSEHYGSKQSTLGELKGHLNANTEPKVDTKRKCELPLEYNKKRHTEAFDKEPNKAAMSNIGGDIVKNPEYLHYHRGCKGVVSYLNNSLMENARHLSNENCKHDPQISRNSYASENNVLSEKAFKNISDSISKLNLFSNILETPLQFPVTNEENHILGEPFRAFNYKNESNGAVAPSMIFSSDRDDFTYRHGFESTSIIDPKVIFKSENLVDYLDKPCIIANEYTSISSTKRSNYAFIDANKSSKLEYVKSQEDLSLIESNDKCLIPKSKKKTILFTYSTPDRVSNKKFNIGDLKQITYKDLNKGTKNTSHNNQTGDVTDASSNNTIKKPRVSQKLLYIQNLSRSSSTKIDETVAYLHYRLRSYENMAVLTRIRNILQNHQLNLIGIYNQLGIPELLVPRRTN